MVACLLAGVVVAQAAGVDVLGSIAHWTEGVFGFGTLPSENTSTNPSPSQNNVSVEDVDIPEEYNEIHELLSERGLKFYFPQIPAEFEPLESSIYIRPDTNCVDFGIGYLRGDDCIGFYLVQNDGSPSTVYEKDDGPVEEYRNNDIIYYIFTNVTNVTTVWMVDNVEYCITTNSTSVDIKELIHSVQSI
jgi:hypothetical protein